MDPRCSPRRSHVALAVLVVLVAGCGGGRGLTVVDARAPAGPGSLAVVRTDPAAATSTVLLVPAGADSGRPLASSRTGLFTGVDWAPGDAWLATTHVDGEGRGELRRLDPAEDAEATIWESPRAIRSPRVAPGSGSVAVEREAPGGGSDAVLVDVEGRSRLLARSDALAPEPRWGCAPLGPTRVRPVGWLDPGRLVAEVAAPCHEVLHAELVVVHTADGTVTPLLADVDVGSARMGPEARTVTATRPGDGEVVRVTVATGEVETLGAGLAATESATRALAAVRPDPDTAGAGLQLVVSPPGRDLDDARQVTDLQDVTAASWRPDGDELAAIVHRDRGSQLWLVSVSTGAARRVDGGTPTSVVVDQDHLDG